MDQGREQIRGLIEDKLSSLSQSISYLYNDYTYHHKNDEMEILQKEMERLKRTQRRLNQSLSAHNELALKIKEAKLECQKADKLIESLKEDPYEINNDLSKENIPM